MQKCVSGYNQTWVSSDRELQYKLFSATEILRTYLNYGWEINIDLTLPTT